MDKDIEEIVDIASPHPQEVIDNAKPGDTILITLRGPASDAEIAELRTAYEENYPGIKFEIADDGAISAAEVISSG